MAKDRLLTATIEYVAAHGVADLSLRRLASAVGTSHRMLLYHFGSKEGLLVEVVRAVEARQRAAVDELDIEPGMSPAELTRRFWRRLSDPALWPHERLFFELYGQALQGRPGTTSMLEDIVESWLEPLSPWLESAGQTSADARADARIGLAVFRGLLLDLLTTGDRDGTDRAIERLITRLYDE